MPDSNSENKKLHIAFVSETFSPEINGVAHTLDMLVSGLLKRSHRISLVCPRQQDVTTHKYSDCITTHYVSGFKIPGYSGLQFGVPGFGLLNKTWHENRPDIIYIATEGPLGFSALKAAQKLGIPVLSGFHTNFHQYAEHYKMGVLGRMVFSYLKYFHNLTNGTLVPAHDLAGSLKSLGITPVHVMGRGVDNQLFSPLKRNQKLREKWGADNDTLVLLNVSRVAAEKNHALLIRTYRELQQHYKKLRLVVVGKGPLLELLSKNNPDIIFTGEISDQLLAEHYASSDLFIFPSETETFGNVTLEAMASGLPVVTFDYAAANTHIVHNRNGLLVEKGCYDEFIFTCIDALKNPLVLKSIGHTAHRYCQEISWEHIVSIFENHLVHLVPAQSAEIPPGNSLPDFNEAS